MKGQIALIAFLAVAVLVRPASSSDEYCTADSCPSDGSELQITGESSFQWWDLISAAKHIITTVTDTLKFHAYKQMGKVYSKTAAALEVVKTEIFVQMKWIAGNIYNKTAHIVEVVYNKTAAALEVVKNEIFDQMKWMTETVYNKTAHIVEGLKNKTTEFAGRVYESIEEFAERVRAVLREEVDSFTEVLWEDGSFGGPFHEDDSKFIKFRKSIVYWALVCGLIILCIMLDYLIWKFSTGFINSIISILALNSLVFLVCRLFGPMWVYYGVWKVAEYIEYCTYFMLAYPVHSAFIFVSIFVSSTAYTCYQRLRRIVPRENAIQRISNQLSGMEERQKEILGKIQELSGMEQRQREILRQFQELKDKLQN